MYYLLSYGTGRDDDFYYQAGLITIELLPDKEGTTL